MCVAVAPETLRKAVIAQGLNIPQGPHTPLPSPGWNPGMIRSPGSPSYRPPPQYQRVLPDGTRVPFA